jgi:Flp pilus assembly protein TadG
MRVMSPLRLREERGAVLPIVVLSLIAIFGMVVLTVDVGGTLTKRRAMVNASDAAALAAAQSFALRAEAQCGTNQATAVLRANQLATGNVASATPVSFQTDCANQTVTVTYTTNQQLYFAQVLGFGPTTPVTTTATAKWGPPQGGATMPLELDPNVTNQCLGENPDPTIPHVCTNGYWFNNGDLTNSGWGLMDLNNWGVAAGDNCTNSGGANDLGGWISQSDPVLKQLVGTYDATTGKSNPPTYVCTTDGGKTTNWATDLQYWANVYQTWVANGMPDPPPPTFLFPINDPSQMIFGPPTSIQKYAIVGFAPMRIVQVIDVGKNPTAAIGGSYSCTANYSFPTANSTLDLSSAALVSTAGSDCSHVTRQTISNVTLQPTSGGGGAYSTPSDYTISGSVITWKKAPATVKVSFNYRNGGACPGHAPDPNAFCLQLAWGGPAIVGEGPALGYGPSMTIALIK